MHTKNFLKMTLNKNLKKIIVTKKTNILNIAKMIDQNGFNGVFVCEKNKRLVGIITDSDLRKLILKDKFSKKLIAEKIMNKSFFSISQKVNKIDYEKILVNSEKALIPILKNKILVDFVHLSDLKNKINDNDRILIIGGFGYIGSLLTERLLKKGKKITILDKNFYGNFLKSKLKKNKNLRIISGDCFNKKKITKALKNCKHVIHLGEIVGDPAANINSNFSIKNNYENTNFVLSECIKNNIHKFIFASSCSVYGQTRKVCNEKSKLNPVSLYAKCKIASEKSILSHKSKTFCPVILRLSTVYGDSPRKRFDLVVNRFVMMAIKKKQIKLFGASSWRPFISVNDVTRAFEKILYAKNKIVKNEIFNVGGENENYKIIDIIKIISKFHDIDYSFTKTVEDKRNYRVSFRKIKSLVKFKLQNKLPYVVKSLLKKYKSEKININNINYYNEKKIYSILNK